ncbi:MAG: AraC family transcriptional regulator [Sneathiella sp.]|nr:AraC family transcriptional regulator [Sneathiella sp.]
MANSEKFEFQKSRCLDGVTLLYAQMEGFNYARHSHEEYSFGVTLSGQQNFFSQSEYHQSNVGNVILFNPEDIHDGNSGGNEALTYFMLYVPANLMNQYFGAACLPQKQEIHFSDAVVSYAGLRESLLNLASSIRDGDNDLLEQESELLKMADILVGQNGKINKTRSRSSVDHLILKARDYIHENIRGDITLDEISDEINISKFHFLRLFREQIGITPYQYVLNHRVNQARKALEKSLSLNDVVFDYGFADLSHFNRRFKSVYGVTPNSYLRTLQD